MQTSDTVPSDSADITSTATNIPAEEHRSEPQTSEKPASLESKKSTSIYIYRVKRWLHSKFPQLIASPLSSDLLKYTRERDETNNAESCPPDDEEIRLQSLTIAEFYGPFQIDSLCKNLKRLKLHEGNFGNSNIAEWIMRQRTSSAQGSWHNLGLLKRRGEERSYLDEKAIGLPDHVDYAFAEIFCHSPTVTCVVVTFIYTNNYALIYDNEIRKKYQTTLTKIGRRNQINSPSFLKKKTIESIRDKNAKTASNWINKNIPGMFSAGLLETHHPSLEFITLKKAQPLEEKYRRYLEPLDLNYSMLAWESIDVHGLTLLEKRYDEPYRFQACLVAKTSSFDSIDLSSWGDHTPSGYNCYLAHSLCGLMSRWALLGLTHGIDQSLNIFRDDILARPSRPRDVLRSIQAISKFVKSDFDRVLIMRDVKAISKSKGIFINNFPDFTLTKTPFRNEGHKFSDYLMNELESRTDALIGMNNSMTSLVSQNGSMVSATENIRLQLSVKRMTKVMLLLAIITTAEPIMKLWPNVLASGFGLYKSYLYKASE